MYTSVRGSGPQISARYTYRPVLLDSTLGYRFPRLLLDIRELDAVLGDPLVVISRGKVTTAVGHPVAVGQELLPVAEVSLERIGLLLGVEPPCFAHSRSVEAAQCQLPGPGQYTVWTIEAPAVCLYKDLVYNLQYQEQLGLALGSLGYSERGVYLVLLQVPRVFLDTSPSQSRHYHRPVTVKAMNDIGFYFGILLSLGASVYGSRSPINNKIPNPAILGKEGLELALPPQRALLMHRGLLLVGFRHVTLHGLTVPGEVSRAAVPALPLRLAGRSWQTVQREPSRTLLAGDEVLASGVEPRPHVPAGGSSHKTYRAVPATPTAVEGTPPTPGAFWIYGAGFMVNWSVPTPLIQGHFA
ncbi:hypothetical protein NA56DRAFT_712439 [Hyaloscypha hepaticicola]|uniref:Uncharacterized protein n=1 Tax=Hyaloscypha hepaticicola TaxID=2082293 RepID=A0A2J6PGE5_9HELO|nr:hypothetical protein NA56DRAFT_712439 [Hyaloscypha hepaticicola]